MPTCCHDGEYLCVSDLPFLGLNYVNLVKPVRHGIQVDHLGIAQEDPILTLSTRLNLILATR